MALSDHDQQIWAELHAQLTRTSGVRPVLRRLDLRRYVETGTLMAGAVLIWIGLSWWWPAGVLGEVLVAGAAVALARRHAVRLVVDMAQQCRRGVRAWRRWVAGAR